MALVTEVEPSSPAAGPRPAARRRLAAVAAAGGVLAGLGGYWALTPHLAVDQAVPTGEAGASACVVTLPAGPADPEALGARCVDGAWIANRGMLPVTLSEVALASVTGPGEISVALTEGTSVDSPATRQVTLGPGEEVLLTVEMQLPQCTQEGGPASTSTLDAIMLTARTGPVTHRRTEVAIGTSATVRSADGSPMAHCTP